MNKFSFKNSFLFIVNFGILPIFTFGQHAHVHNPKNARIGESVEYCHQHTKMDQMRQYDPQMYQQFMADQAILEEHMQHYVPAKADVVYKIPVVFHVLHNNGTENISNDQIIDALNILNRDYRKLNADANQVKSNFQGLPADIEIEFRLATIAPDGSCFRGITRTASPLTDASNAGWNSGNAQFNAVMTGNDVYQGTWAHDKYLNIIVAKEIGGAAGYTFKPNNSGGYTNAIFILHNYLGSIGTGSVGSSRALTHEVGHWLNLSHTWGDNNDPGNLSSCSDDDGIADTPNTVGVTSCKLNENTCGPLANVENYMDYSYCSKMFTPGQRTYMRSAITSSVGGRNKIWKETNLNAVGAIDNAPLCKADFNASKRIICAGESVQFKDDSYNTVTAWTWQFEGGIPEISTDQNPTVTYAQPGKYKVILTAQNSQEAKTETKIDYITVLKPYTQLPFHEGFEYFDDIDNPFQKVYREHDEGMQTYALTNTASYTGQRSATLSNFSNNLPGMTSLVSTNIDLSDEELSWVVFSYRYAHRRKTNAGNKEYFRAYFSKDCGENWSLRTLSSLASLAQSPVVSSSWTPSNPSDWTTVHILFNTVSYQQFLTENFRFKLEFEAKEGNNFFLDDINLYRDYTPSDEVVTNPQDSIDYHTSIGSGGNNTSGLLDDSDFVQASLFPNPSDSEINVTFSVPSAQTITLYVSDISGKVIQTSHIKASAGENIVLMDSSDFANGMYLIQIKGTYSSKTLSFIKK